MQIPIFLDTIEVIGPRQRSDLFIKYHTEPITLQSPYNTILFINTNYLLFIY